MLSLKLNLKLPAIITIKIRPKTYGLAILNLGNLPLEILRFGSIIRTKKYTPRSPKDVKIAICLSNSMFENKSVEKAIIVVNIEAVRFFLKFFSSQVRK